MSEHGEGRHVMIVVFDGVQPLDVVGPHEVFAGADTLVRQQGRRGYQVSVATAHNHGEPVVVRTESGLALVADVLPDPDLAPLDTLVLAGGDGVHRAARDPDLIDWVRGAAPRARRVATVCTGAFLAAHAGLLDGLTVTTHWARAARLAQEFPAITVDAEAIYRRQGKVWTSAGVTAGIDLALALVEDDHGADVAQEVARWLVVFRHRPGGQSQYATPTWTPRGGSGVVRTAQERVEADPGGDHRVPVLAAGAAMSQRHFTRLFTTEVGISPGRYVERVRLEAAREALETSAATVEVIATSCGLGTSETLRRVFHRHLGVAPDAYRQRFTRHTRPASPPRTRPGDPL